MTWLAIRRTRGIHFQFIAPFSIIGAVVLLGAAGPAQTQRGEKEHSQELRLIASIQGPALYKAYCSSCHGADAKGGGPMAKSLRVPPSDLTRISARNAATFPLVRVSRIISGEEQLPSGHGSREMPVWGPIFSHVDSDQDLGRVRIDNLARYLREIQKP